MGNKLYEESDIQSIANAIRSKNGSADRYTVSQMAAAILNIPQSGGESGGTNLPSNVKCGVLHLESNSAVAITIEHGCGATPNRIVCLPADYVSSKGTVGGIYVDGTVNGVSSNDEGAKTYSTAVQAIANVNETTFDFAPRSASYPLIGGHDYFWVAIV
jgi:hypothetical protein